MSLSLLELIKHGGISLIPLGICSVLVIAVLLERLWVFSRIGNVPHELMRRVEQLLGAGHWREAMRQLDASSSPFARIVKATLMRRHAGKEEIADTLAMACDAELAAVTKPFPILGTIGNVAPFIGLFGTVIGIMKAFHEVAQVGAAGATVVSAGIAEALIATAAGLGVGIVAVISNNGCQAWAEGFRLSLERFSTEWSYRLAPLQAVPDAKPYGESCEDTIVRPLHATEIEEPVA